MNEQNKRRSERSWLAISLTRADSGDRLMVDESFSYTLTVANLGPDSATEVRLRQRFPETLATSVVTLPGVSIGGGGEGLALHPATGELWALLRLRDWSSTTDLVTVDPATGLAHRVGTTGDDFISLAFDWNGTLYAVTGSYAGTPESLVTLSQTDASLFALTTSGNLTPLGSLDHRSKGLAFVGLDLAGSNTRSNR